MESSSDVATSDNAQSVEVDNIEEIGRVVDYYNLINRKVNNFRIYTGQKRQEVKKITEKPKRVTKNTTKEFCF